MAATEPAQALRLLARLEAAFGKDLGEPTKGIYIEKFGHYELGDIEDLIEEAIDTVDFLPKWSWFFKRLEAQDTERIMATIGDGNESRRIQGSVGHDGSGVSDYAGADNSLGLLRVLADD